MTDDPIKLYVVVMTILLCVLAVVTYLTYDQAAEFQAAIDNAPRHAKQLKEDGGEVRALCDQLRQSGVAKGFHSSIQNAARIAGVPDPAIREEPRPKRIGSKGIERRFRVEIERRKTGALTRDQIGKFCRAVERDSRNILQTIEIDLRRHTGKGALGAGESDEVTRDTYTGTLIFGLRVVRE